MNDWEAFNDSLPWLNHANECVRQSATRQGVRLPFGVAALFPALSELLSRSTVTSVEVGAENYEVVAWDSRSGLRMGWLCLSTSCSKLPEIHSEHAALLNCFGGIVRRFNEFDHSWLLNHFDVLTAREAEHDASFIEHYLWIFEKANLRLPIEPIDYYSIALEGNGNRTLCHRRSGEVLLFAPDHYFHHIQPLAGCPEYSLYTINGAPTFRDWVEAVATQWLNEIKPSA